MSEKPQSAPSVRTRMSRHLRGIYASNISDPADVVRHSEITQEEAETVWRLACQDWNITDSNEEERAALKVVVAQALLTSTSKDDENLNTRFKFGGVYHSIRPLADRTQVVSPGRNDSYLRVFVRSYDHAYFPCVMYDLLSNPNNYELRQELSGRCGGPVEHAGLMIDTLDAAIRLSGNIYSAEEIRLYYLYRASRTQNAQNRSQAVGEVAARNDTSTKHAQAAESSTILPPKAAQSARTQFSPINLR